MTEYEPRHRAEIETLRIRSVPPSLNYEPWLKAMNRANEAARRFREQVEHTRSLFAALASVPMSETRAGHEWDSRSWFA